MTMTVKDVVGPDYAYELVRDMASKLPPMWSGSPAERRGAEYFRDELAKYGIEMQLVDLKGHISHPGPGTLTLLDVDGEDVTFECNVLAQSEPTDELITTAAHVGSGGEGDYVGVDVTGKIVIVNLNYSPPRPEKMRLAKKHGAAGMIMINWGTDEDDSLPFGTTKFVWGNPDRSSADDMITLPAVAVSRPNGNRLTEAIRRDPNVKIRITSAPERKWRDLTLPVVWIGEGPDSGREFVTVGAHYDVWGGGVTDNLGGVGALIAMVRYFDSIKSRLKRDIVATWWPGHESGIMIGSTWFADSQWRRLRNRCVAYIQSNHFGMGEQDLWYVEASGELRDFIGRMEAPDEIQWSHPLKTGDQSFFGLGIPSTNTYHTASPEQKKTANGEFMGWFYHSDHDTFDKLNRKTFEEGFELVAAYIEGIASAEVLPYRVAQLNRFDVRDTVWPGSRRLPITSFNCALRPCRQLRMDALQVPKCWSSSNVCDIFGK